MLREMRVTKPGTTGYYGPDLIDRWKGRAFQSSPDSSISVVGFEDEQVNWEANSTLIGERSGPVRAIREVWGADSGTNTTKTEFFYRDTVVTKYHLRVHPIPPDGLYTAWDHNHDTASTYYNETRTAGVSIDGRNDDIGNFDSLGGRPAYFDVPDPTFTKPQAVLNWEQVSGKHDFGSLVYIIELKNAQAAENPAVVPYYRDDACFDDGTGDNPSPRPWPGEASTDSRVVKGNEGKPCLTSAPPGHNGPFRQGAFGSHGVHFFFTNDTDNSFTPAPTTELVAQETQFAVPTSAPMNVGDHYANVVKTPLQAVAVRQTNPPGSTEAAPTATQVTGDRSVRAGETAHLEATLTSEGAPVAGVIVYFKIGDTRVGGSVTDENGVASIEAVIDGPARSTTLTAYFNGNGEHASSAATVPFQVTE